MKLSGFNMSESIPNILKDEGCGLDGHSEHLWQYTGTEFRAIRSCSFCNRYESCKVVWRLKK